MHLVYGLIDPRTGELRYVGKSCSGLARPRQHLCPKQSPVTHRGSWITGLLRDGMKPEIEIIEVHDSASSLADAERFWIAYFRFVGCRLTNHTDGGDGVVGHLHSTEAKAKIRARRKLQVMKKHTHESRARIALAHKGKIIPHAVRLEFSKSHGGRPFVDDTGAIWNMLSDASTHWGIPKPSIWKVLNGKMRSTHGRTFRYLDRGAGRP